VFLDRMIFRIQSVQCRECHESLRGRRDKQFCDDSCRAKHHRKTNKPSPLIRQVEGILLKNRSILKELKQINEPESSSDRQFQWLRRHGFDFNYHTHVEALPDGRLAIMCFEEGYILDEHGVKPWSAMKDPSLSPLPG